MWEGLEQQGGNGAVAGTERHLLCWFLSLLGAGSCCLALGQSNVVWLNGGFSSSEAACPAPAEFLPVRLLPPFGKGDTLCALLPLRISPLLRYWIKPSRWPDASKHCARKGQPEHWWHKYIESVQEVEPTIRADTAAATLEKEWHHSLQVSGLGSAPSAIFQIFGLLQILGRFIPAGFWEQNGWRWTLLWLRGFRAGFEGCVLIRPGSSCVNYRWSLGLSVPWLAFVENGWWSFILSIFRS